MPLYHDVAAPVEPDEPRPYMSAEVAERLKGMGSPNERFVAWTAAADNIREDAHVPETLPELDDSGLAFDADLQTQVERARAELDTLDRSTLRPEDLRARREALGPLHLGLEVGV